MAQNTNQNNPQQQKDFNDAINEYRSLLRNISDELGKQRTHIADANAEYRKLDSIARQLQNTEEGISGLTSEQLDKLRGKYEMSLKEIKNQAQQLLTQRGITNLTQTQLNYLKQKGKLDDKSAALLQGYLDDLELEKSFLETIEQTTKKRLEYEKKVKDLTGATGAALDGMKGSMNALGLSSMSNYLNIDAAKKAMEEEADAIARGEKQGGALEVRMAGLKTLAEGFNKALFSTEAIIGFIVKELAKGSQNMADFQKQTGMGYWQAYGMNMEMKGIAAASNDSFITSEKLNKSFATLTEHLGVSADILGGTALVSATNLEQRLGMSADAAAQLTTYTRLQGKDTEQILSNSVATVGAFNKQNRTAINARQVLNDVAGASKSMYLNMGKSTEALTKAATKARALGLSLAQVEKVQESMLNFEESIGNELEANLLLGGGVNLAKAREYSLTGDIKGLTDEIGKQESIRNAFATKNVIAQDAAAKALGLSREELAGMALQQDLNNLSAEEFKNRYGEATYESMKSRSATEKFGDALDKVKDLLGSIIQVFSPIIDLAALLLDNPIAPWFMAAYVAAKVLGGGINGIGKAFSGMYDLGKKALTGLGNLFKKGSLASATSAVPAAGPTAPAAGGGGAGGGLMKSMSSINTTALLKGAAAMAVAAAGIYVFAKAIQELEKVKDWKNVAIGLGAFAVSMGVIGAVGEFAAVGLEALAVGLNAFGAAMMTGFGAVGLAALTVAAIGLGYALNLAAPGIQAFGTVVTAVFAGIASVIPVIVDGFVTLISAVTNGIGPLLALGPALFGIAAGLGAVAIAGITSLPAIGGLLALSVAAPALVSLGMGGENRSAGEAKGKSEEGSMAALEKKMDTLIAVVKAGGNVYMDSNKVGRAQVLGSYKSA